MTLNEFKSWIDGFSEAIDRSPTPQQWEKIKDKLNSVVEKNLASIPFTPSTWPVTPSPTTYPPSPIWLSPDHVRPHLLPQVICGSGSQTFSGCIGMINGEAKGESQCH
jgi:hypothetical protein